MFILDFLCNIKLYKKDKYVIKYCEICDIDLKKLSLDILDPIFKSELNKFVLLYLKNPIIIDELFKYARTRKSKIKFLGNFSHEQNKYITNLGLTDTKLLACAGSGKTRSIIGRINFLVNQLGVPKTDIFMITFSKFAAEDFRKKIKTLFPDFAGWAQIKNFSTIDSLAKSILCRIKTHKSDNVEILSIAFRNYLQNIDSKEINLVRNIKNIRHLFVDEAQDLNQIQFDAIMLLKKHFGTTLHLIGDPNQNIFQFRRSNSSYLMGFDSTHYNLSVNFRSSQEIINFSEFLKPIRTIPTKSATNKTGNKVVVMSKPSKDVHQFILNYVKFYDGDLSEIAIICPTKGTGKFNSVGLSVFFNLFKVNKIPFKQLYDESGNNNERKKDVDKVIGHVNLLTWHGTKGLEFDVVFVMDMYHNLFNIKPSEAEHQFNMYLLYVATTRASKTMFCCTYTDTHGGFFTHWLASVPPEYYQTDGNVKIAQLAYRPDIDKKNIVGITELISELSDIYLDQIDDMIQISDHFEKKIFSDYTYINRYGDEALFGIFIEDLFYLQYKLSRKIPPRKFKLIELIIDSKFIVVDNDSESEVLKNFVIKNQMTWDIYDSMIHSVRSDIKQLVEKYLNRNTDMANCIICTNEFIKIISSNIIHIEEAYRNYCSAKGDYKLVIFDLFYLILVQYAYNNNHYYYINYEDKSKHILLESGKQLFETINKYVKNNYVNIIVQEKNYVGYSKLGLMGEIDFIELYPNGGEIIVDIKCTRELSIKYIIQMILYNFCYVWQKTPKNIYRNYFKILNLLTGIEHTYIFNISKSNLFTILNMLADTGNLKFSNMNLIYDLETTDKMKFHGPFTYKPEAVRGKVFQKGLVFHAETYPEITEIAIVDYDTEMIIINQLVKPRTTVNPEVELLTGIWNRMLTDCDDIHIVRSRLEFKLKYFAPGSKLLAHNGKCFDDKIMICDGLIDLQKFSFLDTMSVIPIHMPTDTQLSKKSVGEIYLQLFGKKFTAHRAMADVTALIKIMKYLNVEF